MKDFIILLQENPATFIFLWFAIAGLIAIAKQKYD